MKGTSQELLDLVMDISYENMAPEVVHETKRIFLDSIGVAIAALKTDKGRYAMKLANRFGGPPESAILGTSNRIACGNAAFANGELINAMDYDANLFPTHAPPSVIPASLALGETIGASGKDILVSIAVGCELSLRLGIAIRGITKLFSSEEGSEVGKIVGTKNSVSAVGVVTVAGALGAAKIMNIDREKLAHVLGLAVHYTPFPQAKWRFTPRMSMAKYVSAGWASMAEVMAVLLAEMGYQADTTPLDGNLGYWRFFGSDIWDPKALTEKLGDEWKMLKATEYKPYPCCRDFHVAIDCLIKIIDEHNLQPDDIESVKIQTHPAVNQASHVTKDIIDHMDAQFSLPYCVSAAANRVRLSEWQDPEKINSPAIIRFMDKVIAEAHPKFFEVQRSDPGSVMTTVEVITKNSRFKEEGKFSKGSSHLEFAKMTDEDLVNKFRLNTSRTLPQNKVEKAIASLMELEKEPNITLVIEQVTL